MKEDEWKRKKMDEMDLMYSNEITQGGKMVIFQDNGKQTLFDL